MADIIKKLELSDGQEDMLKDRLSKQGFDLFFNGIYVLNQEETDKKRFGYRVYEPIGHFNDGFLFFDNVKEGFIRYTDILLKEYETTKN